MCKFCWTLVVILAVFVGGMAYTFLIKGETIAASDGRQVLVLAEGERDMVLSEMRAFLSSVQEIIVAANQDNMQAVSAAAKKVGFAAQQSVPGSLMKKLPMGFKKLGMGTHKGFDQLAMDAIDLGDKSHSLDQLGELMKNCVACHQAYRIDPEQPVLENR
jgi:hypothetical protein